MLNFQENKKLPAGYGKDYLLCFKPLFSVLQELFAKADDKIDADVCYSAFNLDGEKISEALEESKRNGKVIIGNKNNPLAVFKNPDIKDGSEKIILSYSVDCVADHYEQAEAYRKKVIYSFAEKGVIFVSLDGVVIHPNAQIGEGTIIHPGTEILNKAEIGRDCEIGPFSIIENSRIGNRCKIISTKILESVLEDDVKTGPFCNIRPNSRLCVGAKIGDFVEIKNSVIGKKTQASHLTYIGDSDVGERVNFGCGVVTANYDGFNKHRTVIGDDCFVGCNTNLIAPVTLGSGVYTASGSTITENIPDNALGVARAKQTNIDGWAQRFREKNTK